MISSTLSDGGSGDSGSGLFIAHAPPPTGTDTLSSWLGTAPAVCHSRDGSISEPDSECLLALYRTVQIVCAAEPDGKRTRAISIAKGRPSAGGDDANSLGQSAWHLLRERTVPSVPVASARCGRASRLRWHGAACCARASTIQQVVPARLLSFLSAHVPSEKCLARDLASGRPANGRLLPVETARDRVQSFLRPLG